MRASARVLAIVGLSWAAPLALAGQSDSLALAISLERRGSYAEAITIYQRVLAERPAVLPALLGLERSLTALNRSIEVMPAVRAALELSPSSSPVYGIALRVWATAEQPDSLRRYAERWSRALPGDETPYREWGAAALGQRDRQAARSAYLLGRERLNRPDALAPELAQLAALDQDYATATREWLLALHRLPGYRPSAVTSLARAPESARSAIARQLETQGGEDGRRMSAELRARWGDPVGAYRAFSAGLSADPHEALDQLRQFLQEIRPLSSPDGLDARGMILEAIATRSSGEARTGAALEAAQSYADAGDRAAADRMLSAVLAEGSDKIAGVGGSATLIGLLAGAGQVDAAAQRLEEAKGSLKVDDYQRLRRSIAWAAARAGRLDQADRLIANDSTVDGLALAGRLHLYRGDLDGARTALKAAGPYAGTRAEATERGSLLALLQPIEKDTLAALGAAFQSLDRGDTAAAVKTFEQAAEALPVAAGGAELRLLAGQLQARRGQAADAERLLRSARQADAKSAAAAADLELGQLFITRGRLAEAVEPLEHLILTYPESALVPQARHLLNVARGVVPNS